MPRYIDADALYRETEKRIDQANKRRTVVYDGKFLRLIKETPTADVAPRAEVERLQSQVNRLKKYDEQRDIALHARLISETRHKVALEIFGEIDEIINEIYNKHIFGVNDLDDIEKDAVIKYSDDITDKIAELKKKYTEEQT